MSFKNSPRFVNLTPQQDEVMRWHSVCQRKRHYDSEADANAAIETMRKRNSKTHTDSLRAHRCRVCRGWVVGNALGVREYAG